VYLAGVGSAAITHMVPHTFYLGEYPTTMLDDDTKGDFEVHVRLHLWAPAPGKGDLVVTGEWGQHRSVEMWYPAGDSNITVVLPAPATSVKLWWPAGVGSQRLYSVNATILPTSGAIMVTAQRKMGFRYVALVTGNDTDPRYVEKAATEEGTELHGMMFRCNGAVIFARGANVVPTEELEGWYSAAVHTQLVKSSAEANFNMLRVWGGGVYLPQVCIILLAILPA